MSRVATGLEPCSTGTGGYGKARKNLPRNVAIHSARWGQAHTKDAWRWRGRQIKRVDGTTVTMPDTPENPVVYPPQNGQKPDLGLPIARIVGLVCLCSGAVLDAAMVPFKGKGAGEHALFRALPARLEFGDVVLADRYYCSYC